MIPRHFAFFAVLPVLFLNTSVHAQTPDASADRTIWDHNGSVMYLVVNGSSREFYYEKPRPGMLEVGAKPGSLLFRGEVNNGQYSGTSYFFNRRCGPIPFQVKGAILDNDQLIVLTGQAPRVGRNCKTYALYTTNLEFRLLKPIVESLSQERALDVEENKPEISLKAESEVEKPSTSTAQVAAANDNPSAAKAVSPTITQQPLGTPAAQTGAKKEAFAADDLDNYVLIGALAVLIGGLLLFSASQFSRLLWGKRRYF